MSMVSFESMMRTLWFIFLATVAVGSLPAQDGGNTADPFDFQKKKKKESPQPPTDRRSAPSAGQEPFPNLVKNAAFWSKPESRRNPRPWRMMGWRGDIDGVFHDTVKENGGNGAMHGPCLLVKAREPTDFGYAQDVQLKPGTRYRVHGWIRTKGVSLHDRGLGALFQVVSRDGEILAQTPPVSGTRGWQQVEAGFHTGKKGTRAQFICRLGGEPGTASGQAWFGRPNLRQIPGRVVDDKKPAKSDASTPGKPDPDDLGVGPNLLANPGLEEGSGDAEPDDWRFKIWSGKAGQVEKSHTDEGRRGRGFWFRTSGAYVRAGLLTNVELEPNTKYVFGGWVRCEFVRAKGDQEAAGLSIILRQAEGALSAKTDYRWGRTDWRLLTGRLVTGDAAGTFQLVCGLGSPEHGVAGTVWADDFFVRLAEPGYRRPQLDEPVFNRDGLTLDKDQVAALADQLTALVCNFPTTEATTDPEFRACALGVVLRLAPRHREAVVANALLDGRQPLKPLGKHTDLRGLLGTLGGWPPLLLGEDATEDDQALGLYLADLLWQVDPKVGFGPAYAARREGGEGADWTPILPPLERPGMEPSQPDGDSRGETTTGQAPGGDPPAPTGPKITIGPKMARTECSTTTITLTGGNRTRAYPREVRLKHITHRMQNQWDEARNESVRRRVAVNPDNGTRIEIPHTYAQRMRDVWGRHVLPDYRRRMEGWPRTGVVTVTIPHYSELSGSSAVLATAIGFECMLRGLEPDPRIAAVGTWSDTGNLTTHSHLSSMVLGYGEDWTDILLVGPGSRDELQEVAEWGVIQPLLFTHIIEVQSLAEAVAITTGEAPADTAAAIEAMKPVLALKGRMEAATFARNRFVQDKLKGLQEEHPQHLNASLLLQASEHALKPMDRAESLDAVLGLLVWIERIVDSEAKWISEKEGRTTISLFNDRLREIKPRLHAVANKANIHVGDAVRAAEEVVAKANRETSTFKRQVEGARATIRQAREAIEALKAGG